MFGAFNFGVPSIPSKSLPRLSSSHFLTEVRRQFTTTLNHHQHYAPRNLIYLEERTRAVKYTTQEATNSPPLLPCMLASESSRTAACVYPTNVCLADLGQTMLKTLSYSSSLCNCIWGFPLGSMGVFLWRPGIRDLICSAGRVCFHSLLSSRTTITYIHTLLCSTFIYASPLTHPDRAKACGIGDTLASTLFVPSTCKYCWYGFIHTRARGRLSGRWRREAGRRRRTALSRPGQAWPRLQQGWRLTPPRQEPRVGPEVQERKTHSPR